jgi:hypothetical protein
MIWFLGRAHRWVSFVIRDASAGSRWKLCSISQAADDGEGDWSTTPRASASATSPTRAQST